MPDLKPRTSQLITLRQRCERFRCLPFPGGLLEQPAWVMDLFDAIDKARAEAAKEREEEARRERTRAELAAELKKQHGR